MAIESSISRSKSRIKDSYEYALYLSIKLSSLCERLLQVLQDTYKRDVLLKHILKKIDSGERLPASFVTELFSRFQCGDKHIRRSSTTVLVRLIDHIPPHVAVELFNNLVDSKSKLERNRASQIAMSFFDDEIEQRLWDSWHIWHDDALLRVLANYTTLESLKVRFSDIWYSEIIGRV